MADFEKVSLSDDELDVLSNNDFAEIARKGRIDGEISAEELRTVTAETMVRFKGYLANNSTITGMTKETLDGLKTIVVSGSAVVIDPPLDIPGQGGTVGDVAPSISAPKVLPDELSPTTTFDVIRLIQLGYIPIEAPTNPKGTIKRHVMNTPKWIFVGLQKANEWGAKITTNKMIDLFKPAGSHIGYRAQLDKDITDLHTELKSYQATTKESFEFKAELEKQLSLLEQMRSEKDPKALQSITKQYFDSRTKTHFTVGALGYDPAVRKTTAQLDVEMDRAERRREITEQRIKAREQDKIALTTKGAKDSAGRTGQTRTEIDEANTKLKTRLSLRDDKRIEVADKLLKTEEAKQTKLQGEYDTLKQLIQTKQEELGKLQIESRGRTVAAINAEITALGSITKANKPMLDALSVELSREKRIESITNELAPLGKVDRKGNPTPGALEINTTHTDLTRQNTEVDRLKQALKDAQKLKQTNTSKVDKVSTEKLKDHDEKVTRTDKHITKSKEVLEKRKVAEASIIELNTKIKAIETKLAPPIVNTPVERARLLGELRQLSEQKSAQMRFFEADLTRPRDKGAVIDAQKTEVQKEIDKFNTLSTETLELQKRIDAIGTEMEAATKALNAEKDPIKAKKLKSEIGAKIGAANSEIANLNKAAGRLKDNANIQWKHIPDVTLKNVLNKSPLLASVIATPGGVVAKVEEFGHTPNGQKTMKFMYGGLRYVAVAGAARSIGNQIHKEQYGAAAIDALDVGMGFVGFVPVVGNVISGGWDIAVATKMLASGRDLNDREVSKTQAFVRLGFGIVGLIPVVGNVAKGAAAARGMLKTVNAIEKTEKVADVAMKTVALGTAASVAYDVVDITRSTVTHGLTDTAMAVIRGTHLPNHVAQVKTNK